MRLGPFETGHVYHGDCLELMRSISKDSIPMIWTDPPYGHRQNDGDLAHNWEKALGVAVDPQEPRPILNDDRKNADRVFRGMLKEAGRVLRPDCCCCCCCGGGGGPDPLFARYSLWMDARPLQFFHAVVWDKGGLGMGWRYRRNYEFVLVSHRRGGKLLWNAKDHGVQTANVVRIGKILPKKDNHPTEKPVALIEHFLRLHTAPGDLILDPFAGSGSTGVACIRLGREFLGFELDPSWVDIANQRLRHATTGIKPQEQMAGQTSIFDFIDVASDIKTTAERE